MSFESVDLIVQIDWALDLPMIDELIPPRRKVQKSIKKRLFICSQFYPDNNCRNTDVGIKKSVQRYSFYYKGSPLYGMKLP